VFGGIWRIRAIRAAALRWEQGESKAAPLAQTGGLNRHIAVALHPSAPGPMTCGVISPVIVLPQDAPTWSEGDLTRALAHELEHVRRWDFLTHCLARTIAAAYWFHPLVWIAWRRLALEEERACDDAVLAHSDPAAYADQLLALARRLSAAAPPPLLAMAARADLSRRIRAVLNESQLRGRASRKVFLAIAAAMLLILCSAPLTLTLAAQTPQTAASTNPAARFRSETLFVVEDVSVQDSNNNPIPDLKADDFLLTEEGVLQQISLISYQAVDASQSFGSSVKGYYVLGYYTANRNPAINFHPVQITLKNGRPGKLDYRAGFYTENGFTGSAIPPTHASALDPTLTPPEITRKVEALYAEQARRAKYQGTVTLAIHIDATGAVTGATVKKALGLGLDEEAQRAALQWKFAPARKAGAPVESDAEIEMIFRLL
jgi:TonB family protein